jgi:hypothetical protein
VGRITAAAAASALCLTAAFAASEFESFTVEAVGVRLSIPTGCEAEAGLPAEGGTATAVLLTWAEGPYADVGVLLARREASYTSVAIWAGLYQRRLGASSSFEAEGEPLGAAELAAAAADDGLRSSFVVGEGEGKRRIEALFLASGEVFYLVQVSYPETEAGFLGAAAEEMLSSAEVLPRTGGGPPEAGAGRDIERERPSE